MKRSSKKYLKSYSNQKAIEGKYTKLRIDRTWIMNFPKFMRYILCICHFHCKVTFRGYDLNRNKKIYTCDTCHKQIIFEDPEVKNIKK